MYRSSRDVPWHQDQQADLIDVRLAVELLADMGPFDQIYDYGCGLGFYLELLRTRVGAAGCRAFGYDVSPTAYAKAQASFPDASIVVRDLMAEPVERPPASRAAPARCA